MAIEWKKRGNTVEKYVRLVTIRRLLEFGNREDARDAGNEDSGYSTRAMKWQATLLHSK
jgi:hypothetical protein